MKEDGGADVDIIMSRPEFLCAEGGKRHTGNKLFF